MWTCEWNKPFPHRVAFGLVFFVSWRYVELWKWLVFKAERNLPYWLLLNYSSQVIDKCDFREEGYILSHGSGDVVLSQHPFWKVLSVACFSYFSQWGNSSGESGARISSQAHLNSVCLPAVPNFLKAPYPPQRGVGGTSVQTHEPMEHLFFGKRLTPFSSNHLW